VATWNDVRRITLGLPETTEGTSYGNLAWKVKGKAFAWERPLRASDVAALGPDAPHGAILGVRTDGVEMKEALLKSDPTVFFTTPHFDGSAAVLVRLSKIGKIRLRDVLTDAWLVRAGPKLATAFLEERRAD
jgi:hypothetical protein